MDLKTVVGNVAIGSTVCLFLTGIPICRKVWTNRGTSAGSRISPLPFLTAFVSCSFWLFYGIMKDDAQIKVINAFGFLLQIVYIGFYVHVCAAKTDIRKKICVAVVTPVVVLVIVKTLSANDEALTWNLGVIACVASLVFFASPLSNIALVLRTHSTSSLPLPLIALSFVQSILWFLYGLLAKDTFVQIPNLLSTVITAFQLLLFLVFTDRKEDVLLADQVIANY